MKNQKIRSMKVHEQSGYNYKASKSAIDEALQIEKFFRSSWYQQLTSVAGEFLIRKLQDEIRQSE